MANILIINGPNLNLLGKREPSLYGAATLEEINNELRATFKGQHNFTFFQSNHEGALVDTIQKAAQFQGIIINAGAYTHTSIAIRDAIAAMQVPSIEVHLTNIYARESFRRKSLLAPVCKGQITGFSAHGYKLSVLAIEQIIQ